MNTKEITKKDSESVAVVKEKVNNAVAVAEETATSMKSDKDYENASEVLSNIKKVGKLVTQEKNKQLKPLNEALKATRDFWRPIEDQYKKAERILKEAVLSYKKRIDARNTKKEETISNKVEKGEIGFDKAVAKMEENQTETKHADVKFQKVKTLNYGDLTDLSADELKLLADNNFIDWSNKSAIRKAALDGMKIPGIEVVEEERVAV